jgi:hypothetical protein
MVKMYVRHKVADFAKWKTVYDGHDATRKKFGVKKEEVFANLKNSKDILGVMEWENKEQAKNFIENSDIKEAMKEAGVIGAPEINFAS